MRERPILFSAPMVRAILAGTKTQTRRVIKQAVGPSLDVGIDDDAPGVAVLSWLSGDGPGYDVDEETKRVPCPYGVPGDRLWVREAFYRIGETGETFYRADGASSIDAALPPWQGPWKPSIHMPRISSRIDLEVTAVRVERLQDISEQDAIAEGCDRNHNGYFWGGPHAESGLKQLTSGKAAYRDLWESINGPGSWDANPWVWVVEFKRVEQ